MDIESTKLNKLIQDAHKSVEVTRRTSAALRARSLAAPPHFHVQLGEKNGIN